MTANTKSVTTVPTAANGSQRVGARGHAVPVGSGWVDTSTTLRPGPAPVGPPGDVSRGCAAERTDRGLMADLDHALALRADGTDRWVAFADPDHESISGMFGGWTAAIMLGAVERSVAGTAAPRAHRQLPRRIAPGETWPINPPNAWAAGGRSSTGGRTRRLPDRDDILASALVVLANRRPTDGHCQWTMPDAPEPDTLEQLEAPGPQGKQTMIRADRGRVRER